VEYLIYGTRNETSDIFPLAEYVRERIRKTRRRLNSRKGYFPDTVFSSKTENTFYLVQSHAAGPKKHIRILKTSSLLLNSNHISVKFGADILEVAENESQVGIKATSNYILGILHTEANSLLAMVLPLWPGDELPLQYPFSSKGISHRQ